MSSPSQTQSQSNSSSVISDSNESRRVSGFKNKTFKVLLGATMTIQFFHLLPNFRSLHHLRDQLQDNVDNVHQQQQYKLQQEEGISFAVAGFPKCGTTFLLQMLGQHPEIVMPQTEFCDLVKKDGVNRTRLLLQDMMKQSSPKPLKYGIKCPAMVRDTNAIETLTKMSDDTRLIVGLRHPVLFFASFYNFRVWGHYKFNHTTPILSPFKLTDGSEKTFHNAHVAHARFDNFLMQLAKVPLSKSELHRMLNSDNVWKKRISPNPFQIFIYTDDQLQHGNTSQFARDLQHFLGLETPLPDLNSEPRANDGSSRPTFPETINICDAKFEGIRSKLLQHGKESSKWISEKFIESKDVTVSDKKFFIESLRTWGDDPCALVTT
eukprot:scaffold11515_cov200-Skeletonema_menzelii.AAC.1